jgi:hypothetical protein
LRDEERREIERMRDIPPRERLARMMASLVRGATLDAGAGDARMGTLR